jgi:hypothetical protein
MPAPAQPAGRGAPGVNRGGGNFSNPGTYNGGANGNAARAVPLPSSRGPAPGQQQQPVRRGGR